MVFKLYNFVLSALREQFLLNSCSFSSYHCARTSLLNSFVSKQNCKNVLQSVRILDSCLSHKYAHTAPVFQDEKIKLNFWQHEEVIPETEKKPQRNLLLNILQENTTFLKDMTYTEVTPNTWNILENSIPAEFSHNWSGLLLNLLIGENNFRLGLSLVSYLESQGELSRAIDIFKIVLLSQSCFAGELSQEDFKDHFDQLLTRVPIIDAFSAKYLVKALCNTKYYKRSLEIIEPLRALDHDLTSAHVDLILAAIRNHENELLDLMTNIEYDLTNTTALQFMECSLKYNNDKALPFICSFVTKHLLTFTNDQLKKLEQFFTSYRPNMFQKGKLARVAFKAGKCTNCSHEFDQIPISDADFKLLQQAVLENVVVGRTIFIKTSPLELKTFQNFLSKHEPFDVIIDSLNIIHTRNLHVGRKEKLFSAIEHFSMTQKRILLIANPYLKRYFTSTEARKYPNVKAFVVSTTKTDDAFILLAALTSGKDCLIMTQDKLRQHKGLLPINLQVVFQNWLKRNQVFHFAYNKFGEYYVHPPQFWNIGAAECANGWHFPLYDESVNRPFGSNSVLCLRKK